MADIKYIVECDATGAVKSIKDVDAAIGGAAGQADKGGKAFGGMAGQIAIGTIAANLAMKAYHALVGQIGSCITEAINGEKAEKNLEAALSITGRTVKGNIEHYLNFAQSQMKCTTYTDEQIKESQALLLQLTNLDQNGIDRATKGAMGLATTLGIDLHSATMMVTKAMEGNYGALGRVGIKVAENLTAEQKQASMFDQLEKLYGRSAAEINTFGGAVKQMSNMWGEAKEAIGGAVVKSEGAKELIKTINRIVTEATPEIEEYAKELAGFISTVAKVIEGGLNAMERLKEKIGGLQSHLSEEEKAWIKVNLVMGGYSTISDNIINVLKAQGMGTKDLKKTVDTLTKAWEDNGFNTTETLKAIINLKYGDKIAAAFKQVGGAGVEAAKKLVPVGGVVNQIGTHVKNLTKDQIDAAKEAKKMKDELANAAQAVLDKYNPLQAAMRKVFDEQVLATKAYKDGAISLAEYEIIMNASQRSLRAFGSTLVTQVLPPARQLPGVLYNAAVAAAAMAKAPAVVTKSWGNEAKKWVDKNQKTFDQISEISHAAISGMDAVIQQSTNNKMLALDKEYQKRLENIKNSTMSEEEKNKAIEGLDAEYSMKRQAVQRKAAQQGKLTAIFGAIINTAEGMTKALGQGGIFGPILAAVVAAFGAVQIALIRAQPIPLAAGAIFKKPAMLTSRGGQEYKVAEAGEAEIVSSPRRLREAIMGKRGAAAGAERPIVIQNHIYLDGREMKLFITKAVRESGQLGLLGTFGKAVS